MTAKEHYEQHLGKVYAWMCGEFSLKQREQQEVLESWGIQPSINGLALDLGCGHGLQSVSLARLGFQVVAVDFYTRLLDELRSRTGHMPIEVVEDDMLLFLQRFDRKAEVISCMGDTLTHLENHSALERFIAETKRHLLQNGKLLISFRDLSSDVDGLSRFIPVKSDSDKILTCFLEYFPGHVMVHDILHCRENGRWIQSVSAYPKLRLSEAALIKLLQSNDLNVEANKCIAGMNYLMAVKTA